MASHLNFYENLKEANMRLKGTIVLYDGEPYYVMCITNHKPDNIFRVWLDPLGVDTNGMNIHKEGSNRPPYDQYHSEDYPGGDLGTKMDEWLALHPKSGVERKMMNSPKFNKFRPFPMGMINIKGKTNFVERAPTRKVEQGLTKASITERPMNHNGMLEVKTDILSPEFRACILGQYPDGKECLERMQDPKIGNAAVGFDRNFALVRGPLNTLFIGYKADVVGFLPDNDFKTVRLGKDFIHTKEAIGDLGVFGKIVA